MYPNERPLEEEEEEEEEKEEENSLITLSLYAFRTRHFRTDAALPF
jgi:hypothetical protein